MPESLEGVAVIVLAAGHGSRYRTQSDEDKLLAASGPEADAPAVLAATLAAMAGIGERLLVVVRADNSRLLAWLEQTAADFGAQTLVVESNGLGHSLAQAVAACPARRGWLVALGDMPYLQRDSVRRVAAEIDTQRLVLPVYRGQRGHPRGIGACYREELLALQGDRGAQALFAGRPVTEVALDDPGVLQDIDHPTDRRGFSRKGSSGPPSETQR
jgi:molybdenum cofactor cytidylyltransferase